MRIHKEFTIDSAHILDLPYPSKCNRLHGHTYKIRIELDGSLDPNGMVHDYTKFPSIEDFDHKMLLPGLKIYKLEDGNIGYARDHNVPVAFYGPDCKVLMGIAQTTAENIARYLYREIRYSGFPVHSVSVSETPKTRATYSGGST